MAYSVLEEIEKFDKPMRVVDVARVLDTTKTTVNRMVNEGVLPTITLRGLRTRKFDPRAIAFWYRNQNPIEARIRKAS